MSENPLPVFDHPPERWGTAFPAPPRKRRVALPVALLLLTLLTTLFCGFEYHVQFVVRNPEQAGAWFRGLLSNPLLLFYGIPFSFTLLAILLAHEMGHFLACVRHRIDATLPFVIPAPPVLPIPPPIAWGLGALVGSPMGFLEWFLIPFNPFGTFGAVIRIKSMFQNRRQLFDVGIAGPLAGFVFIIPALIAGVALSREFVLSRPDGLVLEFGEPLIFNLAEWLFYRGPEGSSILLHPIGWAAWFGALATSLNLLPIGQLDGGHIVYAVFGPRVHRIVSRTAFLGLIAVSLLSWPSLGYLLFAVLLAFMGFRHPPTFNESEPVSRGRILLAALGLIVFILTFIPVPIQLVQGG